MNQIEKVDTTYYRIVLPEVLTDSTHGKMSHFELITVSIKDSDGAEGVGYTYAVNHGGPSIHAMIHRDLSGMLIGEDPSRIEHLWEKMWWALHYPGRGGIAILSPSPPWISPCGTGWATKTGMPLWRLLGGHDPKVPAYAGGIDLMLPLQDLIAQTDRNIADGFRARR
jgi:L-alanine-DL-glutamate epimerase-like enolase superfamily enzyme